MTDERRGDRVPRGGVRRDLNDVFRNEKGEFALMKLFAYVGQGICCYLLIYHAEYIVDRWDALAILLTFVIAPDLARRIISSKFPASASP